MERRELRLSELLGAPVTDPAGRPVGRVEDLTVRLTSGETEVDRFLVRRQDRSIGYIGREAVRSVGPGAIALDVADPCSGDLAADELLLGRDVLDTQIVDLDGRRLVRVGDVILAATGDADLRVVAVDTGFGAVCRRLGLRRLADRLGLRAVAWDQLHLTSARGHAVQLTTPGAMLHRLSADEVGLLLDAVPTQNGIDIVLGIRPEVAAPALAASHPHTAGRVLRRLRPHEADALIARLPGPTARHLAAHRGRTTPTRRRMRRHDGWVRRIPPRSRTRS